MFVASPKLLCHSKRLKPSPIPTWLIKQEMSSSEGEEYEVEDIVGKKTVNGQVEYLVKWKGFHGQNSWEPAANLGNARSVIDAFERKGPEVQTITDSEEMTEEIPEEEGHYQKNDSVQEIIGIAQDEETKTIKFKVAWKPRVNKRAPRDSWLAKEDLRLHNPEVLVEFLVQKINWP